MIYPLPELRKSELLEPESLLWELFLWPESPLGALILGLDCEEPL